MKKIVNLKSFLIFCSALLIFVSTGCDNDTTESSDVPQVFSPILEAQDTLNIDTNALVDIEVPVVARNSMGELDGIIAESSNMISLPVGYMENGEFKKFNKKSVVTDKIIVKSDVEGEFLITIVSDSKVNGENLTTTIQVVSSKARVIVQLPYEEDSTIDPEIDENFYLLPVEEEGEILPNTYTMPNGFGNEKSHLKINAYDYLHNEMSISVKVINGVYGSVAHISDNVYKFTPRRAGKAYIKIVNKESRKTIKQLTIVIHENIAKIGSYANVEAVYKINEEISANSPKTFGNIKKFYITPQTSELPAGLVFDSATGKISGTPTELFDRTEFVVTGLFINEDLETILSTTKLWITVE